MKLPKTIETLAQKCAFLSIPYWEYVLTGLPILALVLSTFLQIPVERYEFIPELTLQGEWWRLLALPSISRSPFWLIIYCLYIFFVVQALEQAWGEINLSFYILLSYVCGVVAGFWLDVPVAIWEHVLMNISLAFGTLFPNMTFYLFFIVPVRAKWLTLFSGGYLIWLFLNGTEVSRLTLLLVHSPYILFFAPSLLDGYKNWKRKRDFKNHF